MVPPVIMAMISWSADEPGCSGVDLLIQSWVFEINTSCVASSSLTANNGVIVKSAVNVDFISPLIELGPGFSVEKGAEFSVIVNP